MGQWDGGPFGDAFDNIVISDGILTISNYGGSGSRWGYDYSFFYDGYHMRMSEMIQRAHNIFTQSGSVEIYDYIHGTYRMYSVFASDADLSNLLLNAGTFTVSERYFEDPFIENMDVENVKYQPWLGDGYGYDEELLFEMKVSANDAIDMVKMRLQEP